MGIARRPPDRTLLHPTLLLDSLERAMAAPEGAPDELRARASPDDLHLAFAYELALLVRQGPPAASASDTAGTTDTTGAASPAALLRLAQRSAQAGAVPWSTPVELAEHLARLEARLRAADAWAPDRPLWWSPLPALSPAEALWAALDAAWTEAGAAEPSLPWHVYPRLLAEEILRGIAAEIEAAYTAGRLGLEPGGIGSANQKAPQRSDQVAYLCGLEPELLAAVPRLAVLVQWLLGRVAPRLAASIPDRLLTAPATAMLARYPAPSAGYRPHLDNPGGAADNGRAFALILYLNPPGRECAGGEIALWPPGGRVSAPPGLVLPPRGGSAIFFDVRTVPHQVLPLEPGPPRWSLVLWLQDGRSAEAAEPPPSIPELTLTDALQAVPDPPLPPGVLLAHELAGDAPGGRIVPWRYWRQGRIRPRVGLVTTVYRGGVGLDAWCDHHFGLGFDHAVLVFDHLDEPAEAADAARLRARYPEERLTLWSGAEVQAARWPELPPFPDRDPLREWAAAGAASFAHASRQALNASAALSAARTGELGGAPLDWLLHLDADEWFQLEGDGRGGADLHDHFAAAAEAGRALVRYVNHELLLPWQPGEPPRFKVNPRLALARYGPAGWQSLVAALRMGQTDPRPWFLGYHNGKSAVAVAHGLAAAGVHGWYLKGAPPEEELVAGPSILHFHRPTPEAFRRKYLAVAAASWEGRQPFSPSPVEEAAVALLRSLAGAAPEVVERELAALYRRLTTFTRSELAVLEEAGLLLTPEPAAFAPERRAGGGELREA